jgi:hypothetical protein
LRSSSGFGAILETKINFEGCRTKTPKKEGKKKGQLGCCASVVVLLDLVQLEVVLEGGEQQLWR